MEKSAEAFRTIAEVALTLGVAPHVLRFWEQRFPQVAPVKRAGGRRYYRPQDIALLAGLKAMLHDEGLTIRGAQKRLAEDGLAAIQARGGDWLAAQGLPAAAPGRAARRRAATPRRSTRPANPASPPAEVAAEVANEVAVPPAAAPLPGADAAPEVVSTSAPLSAPAPAPAALPPASAADADPAAIAAPPRSPAPAPQRPDESLPSPAMAELTRPPARRGAEAGATLPLFPDLDGAAAPPAPPAPRSHAAAQTRPSTGRGPGSETPQMARYADPITDDIARLTAALRRCDARAGAAVPADLTRDLAALARDLRQLAAKAADAAAAAG